MNANTGFGFRRSVVIDLRVEAAWRGGSHLASLCGRGQLAGHLKAHPGDSLHDSDTPPEEGLCQCVQREVILRARNNGLPRLYGREMSGRSAGISVIGNYL